MKFEQNLLKKKKLIACQRISLNGSHLAGHLGNHCSLTAQLHTDLRDIDNGEVCLKSERNPLRMKKVIVCQITRQMDK